MIESVAVRQRGAFDFVTHYDNLCALQNSFPLPVVKAHITDGVLDVNGDRIRATDWVPILNSLRINKTLNFVAVRSYYQQTLDEDKGRSGIRRKTPAIRSKEITYRLCKALRESLNVTPVLSTIELQGLPLRDRDLATLSKGLAKNGTLQHLSLEYSAVGDDGLDIICQGVKNSPSITSLNLTGCGLSWKGSESLGALVKHQAMRRHNEAWQDSLRYRRPDLDRMPGIRRITINANPMLGDQGATALAEALKDDLWLKALDLQQCGISNQGAKALLDVLKYNTTIIVLDVRQNPLIDQDVTRSIMEQVMINSNGEETEYKWIKSTTPREPAKTKPRKKRTKTLQSSFGKKTIIKVTSGNGRRRTKSAGAVSRPLAPFNAESIKPGPGLPWRTAMRANRYRGYPPEHTPGQTSMYESMSGSSSPTSSPIQQEGPSAVHIDYGDSTTDDQSINESVSDTVHATKGTLASRSLDFADNTVHGANTKQMKIENEGLKRRLREEIIARTTAEEKVLELTIENRRMQQEIEDLNVRRGLLDDDQVLESIESTFQQFHAFLDLLRDAGLGQLISMAGLDQTPIPLDGSESFLNRTGLSRANRSRRQDPSGADLKRNLGNNSEISLSDSRINTSINPNGMDFSFRRHVLPENYGLNHDPTMRQLAEESIQEMHMTSKFDELYEKVLSETEGALSKARSQQSYPKGGPMGDAPQVEEDPLALSQNSVHSQKSQHSQHSQGSHRSHHSAQSQKSQSQSSSHRSHPSGQGQVSQRAEPSPPASQHSQMSHQSQQVSQNHSHKSQPSQRSQKSQQSHKSEHSINHTNGTSNGVSHSSGSHSRRKSPGAREGAGDSPQLIKQNSLEISNGNYSVSFEKSLSQSDISEDMDNLLEDPDQDF